MCLNLDLMVFVSVDMVECVGVGVVVCMGVEKIVNLYSKWSLVLVFFFFSKIRVEVYYRNGSCIVFWMGC